MCVECKTSILALKAKGKITYNSIGKLVILENMYKHFVYNAYVCIYSIKFSM